MVSSSHSDNVLCHNVGHDDVKWNIFRVTSHLCGESPVNGEFPSQRPVTRSFGVFFDLRLNKRLSKQSWGLWFETPSRPLWRHCNDFPPSITGVFVSMFSVAYMLSPRFCHRLVGYLEEEAVMTYSKLLKVSLNHRPAGSHEPMVTQFTDAYIGATRSQWFKGKVVMTYTKLDRFR